MTITNKEQIAESLKSFEGLFFNFAIFSNGLHLSSRGANQYWSTPAKKGYKIDINTAVMSIKTNRIEMLEIWEANPTADDPNDTMIFHMK